MISSTAFHRGGHEVATVVGVVRRRWQAAGPAGFVWAIALSAAVAAISIADHQNGAQHWVSACCGEHDGDAFSLWLARLPGSMLAPAQGLPVWGSLAQILLAFGIAEAAVGRRMTIAVAFLGHVLATAGARLVLTLFSGLAANRLVLDTGPSAATVALAAYLGVVLRLPLLGAVTAAGLVVAAFGHSGLAAGEHAAAAVVGIACGAAHLGWLRWKAAVLTAAAVQHADVPVPAALPSH